MATLHSTTECMGQKFKPSYSICFPLEITFNGNLGLDLLHAEELLSGLNLISASEGQRVLQNLRLQVKFPLQYSDKSATLQNSPGLPSE